MKKIFLLAIAFISINSIAQKLHENGKYIDANGVKLYYEIYGQGEPLLMIHGNGGSFSCFENQVREFSKNFKVILVDCRGRGNSSYQNGVELTFDLQVEDMSLFLEKLNIQKTSILGWSDGGIIGLLMAKKHPEKVDKLVTSGANIFPEGVIIFEDMKKTAIDLEKENSNHKNDLAIDLNNLDLKYPNLNYSDLNVIQSKTLIIAGDHDLIKGEHTLKIYEAIPNAQLAILPNSSHSALIENSKLFNEIVLNFLMQQ
ncbi:MAG: alpha/beta hydrolase [Flavobacterium sp.]|uniref:alpha/beta fold hydrolase n=1 Tax=Flavobacterium sp. TaxID=239 RepID=UPI0026219A0A|nr:alpha/beta hydrolase [Flavobacterium sp.]MDD5149248.1 alpha/beta hydrolase [Flavobacterium sp.]